MSHLEIRLETFTHDLWEMLLKNGEIDVSPRMMKEALYDENEVHNPKLGMSNREWMFGHSGVMLPTKREIFVQWCYANHIQISDNPATGDTHLKLMPGGQDDTESESATVL